ncbi:MAG TPA: tubulin-like doman-containing protein, partial [Candidatus Eremiobacteraeota bacterium]|nr:tubulin-like doman-containing protein [Candidatus Eremiobacteraeota bacterium]
DFRDIGATLMYLPEDIKEATRAIARSIFWENLDDISGRLDKKLIDVSLLSNRAVLNEKGFELAEANDFDIFLIAALDDPLASGIYIDMIYLTEDRVIYNHGTSNRYALLFLPALLEGTMKDKNEMQSMACAALSELEHFLQKKEFKKYYYPGHLEVEIKEKPFNAVFLVDYINSQGFALQSESERNQMFREMLRGMILTPLGPNLKSLPHITSSLEGYVDGKNTSYGSFGISIMQFPASLVRKYCACLLGERIYSGILLREDINENKINQEYETCMNFINSIQDSSFIPPTPKLDRKQFEGVDPSILMNRIKHEAGLLESRFTEEIQRDFQKQENLEKIQTTVKDHVNLLSKDTSTALRSVPVFMDKVYNEIKAKKEETKKKYQYIREIVQQDEKNHLGTFDLFQSVIDSFAIPFIGAIIPAKRIKLIGILSCIPLLIILIAAIIILPLFILFFAYLVPFFWYLRSWKCYFERYFESRDALFNHIDNKILNRGKLISLEFKLRELEKIEEFCLNYIDYFEKIIMKLSGISKEFKEEAKDIREEIFAPRGALTYLLITDKYIETYRKDGEKTLSYEAKSLYENIGNWDDPSPVLKEKTTKILWERYAFIQEISADELLRGQENSLFKIEDILRMSHPFWTIDEIKLSQSGNRGKIYFCGVRGAEESFLAKGLKEKPLFSNMIFFNLNNPHILLLGQIETGSPLFALKTFSQMRKSYKFLSTQKIYRAIEDATTEVLPLKMTEKYSQIRRIYLPSTLLGIYNAPLHMEEAEIYQNLIDNPDFLSIIEEKLQRFIQEQGKDTVIKRLMEISSEKTFSAEDREVIREYINDLRRET